MASLGEDLLGVVNKLQDLVFHTIGNDSLDLPQLVRPHESPALPTSERIFINHMFRSLLAHSRPASHPC